MKILRKIFNFQGAKTIGGGTIVGGLYIFGTLWYLYTEKERIIGTNIMPSEESVRQAIEIKQQYGNDYMNTQELAKQIERSKIDAINLEKYTGYITKNRLED